MRIAGIDIAKTAAVFAVICIHTHPFGAPQYETDFFLRSLFYLINHASKFAVPFFFAASGYFYAGSLAKGEGPWRPALAYSKRLIPLFLIWSAVYGSIPATRAAVAQNGPFGAVYLSWLAALQKIAGGPLDFLMCGIGIHMWFLPALLIALWTLAAFAALRMQRYLLPVAIGLFVFGLLAGPYSPTPLGLDIDFNTRNGPFFSTLFASLGFLSFGRARPGPRQALFIASAGFTLQVLEAVFLREYFHVKMNLYNYLAGTVPFAMGIFFLGLSYPRARFGAGFQRLGRYTLGAYLAHPLVMHPVSKVFSISMGLFLFQLSYPVAVFLLSMGLTLVLVRLRFIGRLVQ